MAPPSTVIHRCGAMMPAKTRDRTTAKGKRRPGPVYPETTIAVDDVLVFEHSEAGFSLIGGSGRGAGWAGIVDVGTGPDSLVGRAWQGGRLVRQVGDEPSQIVGPYYARNAIATPVGQRHVVVFGSYRTIDLRDADVVRLAASTVERTHGVPADKLLADELELVHVLRALMAYRPENVRDTLRHVATVAARALSCEVALIRVEHLEGPIVESIAFDAISRGEDSTVERWLAAASLADAPLLEQAAAPGSWPFGVDVASHLTLPLGNDPRIGALALGHLVARPRGFTALCQRIGRAVAEAAELLISQAAAREQLAAERDLLARISGTDALTGIANRRAWDDAASQLSASADAHPAYVISCDLDGLKRANDRYGHTAGDALIRATANLLTTCLREGDLVARMGGDEFAILLRDADATAAVRVRARIRRSERLWRVTEHGLTPRMSLGFAAVVRRDVEAARNRADAFMYANKRRRFREASAKAIGRPSERRRSTRPV